jgi:hypothetical protein
MIELLVELQGAVILRIDHRQLKRIQTDRCFEFGERTK